MPASVSADTATMPGASTAAAAPPGSSSAETAVSPGTAIVVTAHEAPRRPPLQLRVGEQVEVGQRDSVWPEFAFVTGLHGSGWVPVRHVSRPAGRATVTHDYDTTQLSTVVGEQLEVLEEDAQSGWLWGRSARDREGWVPIKTVRRGP